LFCTQTSPTKHWQQFWPMFWLHGAFGQAFEKKNA